MAAINRPNAPFRADSGNDPLVGTQERPDEAAEVLADPEEEAAFDPTTGAPEKSRVVAGVLGIFLGGVGAHRFYLGFHTVALCQLAAFLAAVGIVAAYGVSTHMSMTDMLLIMSGTTIGFSFWGAVEGFMILGGMMPHDGHAHPLR
jgi:TM2 domain-containing membrane protein YozV